jgi:hypothetical protein
MLRVNLVYPKLSFELKDNLLIVNAHNRIGRAYWSKGDLTKAFEELIFSIQMAENINNPELRAA